MTSNEEENDSKKPSPKPIESYIKLLKALQGKNPNMDLVMERTGLSRTPFYDRKAELEQGIEILGWDIQIQTDRKNRGYGVGVDTNESTLHPIFLCLNLAEVITLLDALRRSNEFGDISEGLFSSVYLQLTEYAQKIIEKNQPALKPKKILKLPLQTKTEAETFDSKTVEHWLTKPNNFVRVIFDDETEIEGYLERDSKRNIFISVGSTKTQIDVIKIKFIFRVLT